MTAPTFQPIGRPKRPVPENLDITAPATVLAKEHGVSLPTVYRWLFDIGANRKTGPAPIPAPADFDPAMKLKDACAKWGVCTHTARRWKQEAAK